MKTKNFSEGGRLLSSFLERMTIIDRQLPSWVQLYPSGEEKKQEARIDLIAQFTNYLPLQFGDTSTPSSAFGWDITNVDWLEFLSFLEETVQLPQTTIPDSIWLSKSFTFDWKGHPKAALFNSIGLSAVGGRVTFQPNFYFALVDGDFPITLLKDVVHHIPVSPKAKNFSMLTPGPKGKRPKTKRLSKDQQQLLCSKLAISI